MGKMKLKNFDVSFHARVRRVNLQQLSRHKGEREVNERRAFDFLVSESAPENNFRSVIDKAWHADEADTVRALLEQARLGPEAEEATDERARSLVEAVRSKRDERGLLD